MPKLIALYGKNLEKPDLHNIPKLLRGLAKDIQKDGNVKNVIVVMELEDQAFEVCGFGPDGGDASRAIGILEWGKHWLMTVAFENA